PSLVVRNVSEGFRSAPDRGESEGDAYLDTQAFGFAARRGAAGGRSVGRFRRPVSSAVRPTKPLVLVDVLAALLADADLLAGFVHARTRAGGLLARRAHQHHVGHVDGGLDGHDAALGVLLRGAHGLLDDAHLLHDDAL